MPIYVYHCSNCDHQFDQYQHFTDEPLTVCPVCDRPTLHKIYQPVGIVFKGKGFYATDNRSTSGLASGHVKEETGENNGSKSEVSAIKSKLAGDNGSKPVANDGNHSKEKKTAEPVAASHA